MLDLYNALLDNPEKTPGDLEIVFVFSNSKGIAALKELQFKYATNAISVEEAQIKLCQLINEYGPAIIASGNHCSKATLLVRETLLNSDDAELKAAIIFFQYRTYTCYVMKEEDFNKTEVYTAFKLINALSNKHVTFKTPYYEVLVNSVRSAFVFC